MTAALLSVLPAEFAWAGLMTYLRIQACILAMPGFGERLLPPRVKIVLALAITPLLAPAAGTVALPEVPSAILGTAAAQIAIGFVTGGLVRLMAMMLDVAASAIAASTSLSQLVGGANEASPHPIGNLLHLGGLAVLFALGFPLMLVDLLRASLELWPVGTTPAAAGLASEVTALLARGFALAMTLAAPFVLGGLLFQALSGVVNKVMPALPVVFIGASAQILLALIALALLGPLLVGVWAEAVLSLTLPGLS